MEALIERCCICGRHLKLEESIARGMGDVCAAKMGLFIKPIRTYSPKRYLVPPPDYTYHKIEICGNTVAVAIDSGQGHTITNSTDFVCEELRVSYLIFRDTDGNWNFFDTLKGLLSLDLHGIPTISMDSAIEITRIRYFNDLGGLFSLTSKEEEEE